MTVTLALPLTCLLSEVEWTASSPRSYGERSAGRNADGPLSPFLRGEGKGEGQVQSRAEDGGSR
jgi:hypothetical protein